MATVYGTGLAPPLSSSGGKSSLEDLAAIYKAEKAAAAAAAAPAAAAAAAHGGGSSSIGMSAIETFTDWMGRPPTSAEKRRISSEGWTETTMRQYAIDTNSWGKAHRVAYGAVLQIAAAFYDGDPSLVPQSIVDALIRNGTYTDASYLTNQYFPSLKGASLTNPMSKPFIDKWVEMTGKPPTADAIAQLDKLVRTYGFTDAAQVAFDTWAKTTNDAITGNYGADLRYKINTDITKLFGRDATVDELASTGDLWNMSDAARLESLRGAPEYNTIYAGKPDWMDEGDWVAAARSFNLIFHNYYGDNVTVNADGSLTLGGAQGPTTTPSGLGNWGIDYLNPEMVAKLVNEGYSPEQLQNEFSWQQQAAYNQEVYGDVMTEAFGNTFTSDEWYSIVSGGKDSGILKAKLNEAQTRVAYREAYMQVFGADPEPTDYERIMGEFISPDALIKDAVATESAKEMFPEINDLLGRVYGDNITEAELKDMALGRAGSGELKALIKRATELDSFTSLHKQYYGAAPSPDDYAKYAGYTSSNELQWEITTKEAVDENRDIIKQALVATDPDEPMITDEDLFKMYGGQQGSGEVSAKVAKAKKLYAQQQSSEEWSMYGADRTQESYTGTQAGTFKTSAAGLGGMV